MEEERVREGTSRVMEDPINLFIELRRLLSARKAGHNNLDSDILRISKQLSKQGMISKDKFIKYTKL